MSVSTENDLNVQSFLKPGNRAYLIGIGGIGMSGLARTLKHLGLQVSGSDVKQSEATAELVRSGISVYIGHDMTHVHHQDLVITRQLFP